MTKSLWSLGLVVAVLAGCRPAAVLPTSEVPRPLGLSLVPAPEEDAAASLEVALADAMRSVQALPPTWDTVTLALSHPTVLLSPRVASLSRGPNLKPNGSGGFTATGALGILRPAPGYTLMVQVWDGGEGDTLVGERQIDLDLVAGPNAVTMTIEGRPALSVTAFTPAYGFPGDIVTLNGAGFSLKAAHDQLSLGGIATPVTAASSVSLTTVVPDAPSSVRSWQVRVGASVASRAGFSILGLIGSALSWVSLASRQQAPAIVPGSGAYFLAWQDDRLGAADSGIYGRRMGVDGTLVGEEVAVATAAGHQRSPEVAYNSALDQYVVVYEDAAGNGDIRGQIVKADGTLRGASFGLATGADAQSRPQVAAGAQYAAVWTEEHGGNKDVYGRRFLSNGLPLGLPVMLDGGAGAQENPAIAADPATGRMLVVWEDDSSGVRHIRGLTSNTLSTLLAGPFDLTPAAISPQTAPRVAVDTTTGDFLVVWVSQSSPARVLAQRLTSSGALVGATFTVDDGSGAKSTPRLAYQPYRQKFLVTWSDDRNGTLDLYGQYAGSDGTLWGANFAIAAGAGDQGPGAIAVDPVAEEAMVAYEDSANAGDLKGQRVR